MADGKAYDKDEVGHTFQFIFCVRLTLSHPGVNSPTPPQLEAQAGNEEAKGAWRRKTPMLIAGAAVPYSPVSVTETGEEGRLVYVG